MASRFLASLAGTTLVLAAVSAVPALAQGPALEPAAKAGLPAQEPAEKKLREVAVIPNFMTPVSDG
jgi:hypothetical protein